MAETEDRANAVERVAAITATLDPEVQRHALRAVGASDDPLTTADVIERTTLALQGMTPVNQREAFRALTGVVPNPDQPTSNQLWRDITIGLLALLGIALIGLVVMLGTGHSPEALVTVFTALLTGTLGLFAPSPAGAKS